MNVIAAKTIRAYRLAHPVTSLALDAWLRAVKKAAWQSPSDVQSQYPKVSILKDGRLVFNIVGNDYRLTVRVNYKSQSVYVRWFGTHQDYDRIDANIV